MGLNCLFDGEVYPPDLEILTSCEQSTPTPPTCAQVESIVLNCNSNWGIIDFQLENNAAERHRPASTKRSSLTGTTGSTNTYIEQTGIHNTCLLGVYRGIISIGPWIVVVIVVVVFTLNRSFYPTTLAVPPVSVLFPHPREIHILWSDSEAEKTKRSRFNVGKARASVPDTRAQQQKIPPRNKSYEKKILNE